MNQNCTSRVLFLYLTWTVGFLLSSCSSQPNTIPTETITIVPTSTRLAHPTSIPFDTATKTSIPTVTPTQTIIPSVTATKTPKPAITATQTIIPTQVISSYVEQLRLPFSPDEWEVGFSDYRNPDITLIEFIHPGDDIENWQELLTIQNFALRPGFKYSTPRSFYEGLREQDLSSGCASFIQWNIIEEDINSILYEWQLLETCQEWPIQHEIARVIYGDENIFRIAYAAKVDQIPSEVREDMIKILKEAEIVLAPE